MNNNLGPGPIEQCFNESSRRSARRDADERAAVAKQHRDTQRAKQRARREESAKADKIRKAASYRAQQATQPVPALRPDVSKSGDDDDRQRYFEMLSQDH